MHEVLLHTVVEITLDATALNLVPGQVTPNQVTVALSADSRVSLYNNSGTIELLADLTGFYNPDYGAEFLPLPPTRVLDTREGIGTGCLFVFVPMLGETVVPQLLGGGEVNMLGGSIASLVRVVNYSVAAALSVVVLIIMALLLLTMKAVSPVSMSADTIFEGLKR